MRTLPLPFAALLLLAPGPAAAKTRPLPTYAHALRCAGLTQAWAERVRGASGDDAKPFDAGLYWGLAASDVARRSGLRAARMEADVKAAAARAKDELARIGEGSDPARRELRSCLSEVPRLKR